MGFLNYLTLSLSLYTLSVCSAASADSKQNHFNVTLPSKPELWKVIIDLAELDPDLYSCEIKSQDYLSRHFMCMKTSIIKRSKLDDDRLVFPIQLKLNWKDRTNKDGSLTIYVETGITTVSTSPSYETTARSYTIRLADPLEIREEVQVGNTLPPLFYVPGITSSTPVEYKLSGGDASFLVVNSETGHLTSGQAVDREGPNARLFLDDLTVEVNINNETTLTENLNVTIVDVNDHAPIYSRNTWHVGVEENAKEISLATLDCTDLDSGGNGDFVHYIVSTSDVIHVFSMLENTLVADGVDYEAAQSYNLTIIAVDQPEADDPMTGTTTVLVTVIPQNEFYPEWAEPFQGPSETKYSMTIPTGTTAGQTLMTLLALDSDAGIDGDVTYGLYETISAIGTRASHYCFHVMPNGSIITIQDLEQDSYWLHVYAVDNGTPSKIVNATIVIKVADVVDGSFHWVSDSNILIHLLSNTSSTDVLTEVLAEGPGSGLAYAIDSIYGDGTLRTETDLFQMDDGSLKALKSYSDYQAMGVSTFVVSITATQGSDVINCTVKIAVDENNPPEWLSPFTGGNGASATVYISEDIEIGTVVATVQAQDGDTGINGETSISIMSILAEDGSDAITTFILDESTGELKSVAEHDLEGGSSFYTVNLRAADNGNPRKTIEGTLIVQIDDVNEFQPQLDETYYTKTLTCDTKIGDEILNIHMIDADATSQFQLTTNRESEFLQLTIAKPSYASVTLTKWPPVTEAAYYEFLQLKLSDGGRPHEKKASGALLVKFLNCDPGYSTGVPVVTPPPVTDGVTGSQVTDPSLCTYTGLPGQAPYWQGTGGSSVSATVVILCVVLFLGYVVLGTVFIIKKFNLLQYCTSKRKAVYPDEEQVIQDETGTGAAPAATIAATSPLPSYMDSYPRELPQPSVVMPPVSMLPPATPANPPVSPIVTPTPAVTTVPAPSPMPPVPPMMTPQPPVAVPPMMTPQPPVAVPPLATVPRLSQDALPPISPRILPDI